MKEDLPAMQERAKQLAVELEKTEIQFEKPKEEIKPKEEQNLVKLGIDSAVVHKIKNDEDVQSRLLKTADTIIDTKISKEQNDAEKEEKISVFQNNKDACDLYGINEETVPKWVVGIASKVQNFWYAVWLVVGFFTTAPIVFLSKKIKVVFKRMWIAVILAIVIYLSAIFVPILINYLK